MDFEVLWQQQVDDHIQENNGKPTCVCQEEWAELFSNTCENITAKVCFCQSEFTGLTATRMTRGDELPRHMISDSEWPRFLQATVTEWAAHLGHFRCHDHLPGCSKRHTQAFVSQNRSFES